MIDMPSGSHSDVSHLVFDYTSGSGQDSPIVLR